MTDDIHELQRIVSEQQREIERIQNEGNFWYDRAGNLEELLREALPFVKKQSLTEYTHGSYKMHEKYQAIVGKIESLLHDK